MAKIQFKGKVEKVYNMDNSVCYEYINVPQLDRKHCDMHAFRIHPKYGAYANSDLFKGMLKRIRSEYFANGILRLDAIPEVVNCDTSGFLAIVSFEV